MHARHSLRFTLNAFCILALLFCSAATATAFEVEYDGIIKPSMVVELGAPLEGIVSAVNVDRSSLVSTGQPLVELESSLERAAYAKAAAIAEFDGEIELQKARLAFTKRAYNRLKNLQSINAHDKDQSATDVSLTAQRLKKAQENQLQARLDLRRAEAMLKLRTVRSPIDGIVVDRYVEPGEYVGNQPLLRLARINPLVVEMIAPAKLFGSVQPGMEATIVPELGKYPARKAKVKLVDAVIDEASNTFGIRLEVDNEDHSLPSGLKCLVRLEISDQAKKND